MSVQTIDQSVAMGLRGDWVGPVETVRTNLGALIGMSRDRKILYFNSTTSLNVSTDEGVTVTTIRTFPQNVEGISFLDSGEVLVTTQATSSAPGYLYRSNGWTGTSATSWTLVFTTTGGYIRSVWGNHQWSNSGPIVVTCEYGVQSQSADATTAPEKYATRAYYSPDYGATWQTILNLTTLFPGTYGLHCHAIAYDPYWARIWVTYGDTNEHLTSAQTNIMWTDDLGATWTHVPLPPAWTGQKSYPFQDTTIAITEQSVVFMPDGVPYAPIVMPRRGYRVMGDLLVGSVWAGKTGAQGISFAATKAPALGTDPSPILLTNQGTTAQAPPGLVYMSPDGYGETWVEIYRVEGSTAADTIRYAAGPTVNGNIFWNRGGSLYKAKMLQYVDTSGTTKPTKWNTTTAPAEPTPTEPTPETPTETTPSARLWSAGMPSSGLVTQSSVFVQPVADATVDPESASKLSYFIDSNLTPYFSGIAAFNVTQYNTSLYTVRGSEVAKQNLGFRDEQKKAYIPGQLYKSASGEHFMKWPLTDDMVPASGNDGHLAIYDEENDILYSAWRAKKDATQGTYGGVKGVVSANAGPSATLSTSNITFPGWSAVWGGVIHDFKKGSGSGRFPNGMGTSASGLATEVGSMGVVETQQAIAAKTGLNHALSLAIIKPRKGVYSYPAQRTDGPDSNPLALMEGQRLRLKASYNVEASNLTPLAKVAARTAQTLGFIVTDKAGTVNIAAESGNPFRTASTDGANPWTAMMAGKASYDILKGFPWSQMEVIAPDWGKPASPNAPAGTTNDATRQALLGVNTGSASGLTWNSGVNPAGRASSYAGREGTSDAIETMRGRAFDTRHDFQYQNRNIADGATAWNDLIGMQMLDWFDPAAPAVLGMKPFPTGGSYTAAANGDYDTYLVKIGQTIASKRPAGTAKVVLRLAWEMNGNWYDHAAYVKDSNYIAVPDYVAGSQRIITKIREGAAGRVSFAQSWSASNNTRYQSTYWGDAYADFIGIDSYDAFGSSPGGYHDEATWLSQSGVGSMVAFARAHNKLVSLDEWGGHNTGGNNGGGDNPDFAKIVVGWCRKNADILVYESQFNDTATGNVQNNLWATGGTSVQLPLQRAAYIAAYQA